MKVAIVGFGKQGKLIANLLSSAVNFERIEIDVVDLRTIPKKSPSDLNVYDAFFISTPNSSLKSIVNSLWNLNKYLWVEKPAAFDLEDLAFYESLPGDAKKKIFVNYSFGQSPVGIEFKKICEQQRIGTVIKMSVFASHRFAFTSEYKRDWRSELPGGVADMVSCHYFSFAIDLLGQISNAQNNYGIFAGGKVPDTATHQLTFTNGITADIFTSYAAGFISEIKLIGTLGTASYEGDSLVLFNSCDKSNQDSRFTKGLPQPIIELSARKNWLDGQVNMLRLFLQTVELQGEFIDSLDKASQVFRLLRC